MATIEEKLDITGIPQRSAYLTFQLIPIYAVAVVSLQWGVLSLPIVLGALFAGVFVILKQVEGVVEDTLER